MPTRLFRPRVLLPLAAGAGLLLLSPLLGWPALLAWIGGGCLGFGLGVAAAGGGSGSGATTRSGAAGVPQRSTVTPEQLTDLELRAKVRGDFETAGLVDRLQALHDRLKAAEADAAVAVAGQGDPLALDMLYKLRRMYEFSAASLERALALYVGSREMATAEARQKVLDQRAAIVAEVAAAVTQIEAAVDRVRVAATTAGDAVRHEKLVDLNRDLDRQLEVARRVDEQLRDVELRARGDYSEAERYVTGRSSPS